VGLRIIVAAWAALFVHTSIASAQPQTDVRREIAVVVMLAAPVSLANADVSALRPTAGPQLGDLVACVRLTGGAGFIAVFFEAGKVINYRRAVAVDRCDGLAYEPLAAPAAATARPIRSPKTSVQAVASPVPIQKGK
jgi:hypothetical protein